MKDLMMFENDAIGSIRAMEIDEEIWFVGKDVANALGYKDAKKAISRHCEDAKFLKDIEGGQNVPLDNLHPQTLMISEPDSYALVIGCTLPQAKPFKRWLFKEVIPSIRKTGQYSLENLSPAELGLAQAYRFLEQEKRIKKLEREKASQEHLDDLDAYARGRYPGFSTVHDYVKPISAILN